MKIKKDSYMLLIIFLRMKKLGLRIMIEGITMSSF